MIIRSNYLQTIMSAEFSFTKRAAVELSRCFNGLTVLRSSSRKSAGSSAQASSTSSSPPSAAPNPTALCTDTKPLIGSEVKTQSKTKHHSPSKTVSSSSVTVIKPKLMASTKSLKNTSDVAQSAPRRGSRNGLPPPQAPPKTSRARRKNYLLSLSRPRTVEELLSDKRYLNRLFSYFTPIERCILAQVSHLRHQLMLKIVNSSFNSTF